MSSKFVPVWIVLFSLMTFSCAGLTEWSESAVPKVERDPVTGEFVAVDSDVSWGDVVNDVWDYAAGFVPVLAGFEGLMALAFPRKRRHYANAVKAVVPFDGKVEVGPALTSVVKALGAAHSSDASKAAANTV